MTRDKIAILGGIMLGMLLAALDQTIVATAMPRIVQEFNALSHLSWVFTAYMLASAITVPIYGKLSDIFGRRGLYILGIIIFLIGSILSGAAQSMLQLIIFRGVQGIGGGAIMVNSFAVIADVFPPRERAKWQGLLEFGSRRHSSLRNE
jgi:MFS family permease